MPILSYILLIAGSCFLVLYGYAAFCFILRSQRKLIGFLHPASGAGGGGERVLWVAVQHLLKSNPQLEVAIYTSEFPPTTKNAVAKTSSDEHLLTNLVPTQFGISFTSSERARIHIHYIPLQGFQNPNLYPVGRLFFQSVVGGLALAVGTLTNIMFIDTHSPIPDYFIDSVGIPFSYFWLRLASLATILFRGYSTKVGCYVHYPYISSDMIDSVRQERVMPNNPLPAKGIKKFLKLQYYSFMAMLYRYGAGYCVNGAIACNSTWTRNHIKKMWGRSNENEEYNNKTIQLLFPPVNAERFKKFDLDERFTNAPTNEILLISVGQFRPEKDHPLLLRSFSRALKKLQQQQDEEEKKAEEKDDNDKIKLRIIGGARNADDRQRVQDLIKSCGNAEEHCSNLKVGTNVHFHVDAPFEELENAFRKAAIGLHTMRDEHFGIVVVEYMASGCITIANNSAGPAEIVTNGKTGYLCQTEEEYANTIVDVVKKIRATRRNKNNSGIDSLKQIQVAARSAASKYGDGGFGESFEKIFGV